MISLDRLLVCVPQNPEKQHDIHCTVHGRLGVARACVSKNQFWKIRDPVYDKL